MKIIGGRESLCKLNDEPQLELVAHPPYPPCAVLFGRIGEPSTWNGCGKPPTLVGAQGTVAEGIGYCAEHEEYADPELWRSQFIRVPS